MASQTSPGPHTRADTDSLYHPDFAELVRVSARIGCLSFGGPAGQIALMHRELVEQRRWIDESEALRVYFDLDKKTLALSIIAYGFGSIDGFGDLILFKNIVSFE